MIAKLPAGHSPSVEFKSVYEQHFTFVWRVLRRLGVSEADQADATQDVFVVVHRRLGEFTGRAEVTTWLYEICIRVAKDHARKKFRFSRLLQRLQEAFVTAPRTGEPPNRDGRHQLESILEKMPDAQRTVFVLFELEELSGEQIAAAIGCPIGTVRSRLRLAREFFQRAVTQLNPSPHAHRMLA